MRRHATMTAGMALITAAGLAGASQVSARPASVPSLPGSAVSPTLHARISGSGFKLTGDRSFTSNRVSLTLHAVGKEREVEIVKFRHGYTLAKAQADIRYYGSHGGFQGKPTAAAIKAIDRIVRNVGFFGGADADAGQSVTETIVLPPGKYTVLDDGGNVPKRPRVVHVSGPAAVAAPGPVSSATVTMKTNKRFGGASTLPASGTITVVNHSTESPHFLALQHVKNGTTRKQVRRGIESNGEPSWLRKGSTGTDVLGKGKSQTLMYSLPKGTYAEICFFPDPKNGIPHAFMGMIRIVHLS